MGVYLHLDVGFDVPKACKLVKMSSKGVSCVIKGFVACTDEAASFKKIVPLVESRGSEVLVNWMDLKLFEGVDRCDGMLPNVSYDIIEVSSFEHVDWVG